MAQSGAFLVSSEMCLFQLTGVRGAARAGAPPHAPARARRPAHTPGARPPLHNRQDATAPAFKAISALAREPRPDLLPGLTTRM